MDKNKLLILILLLLTHITISMGVFTFWVLIEQLLDGKIDSQNSDTIMAIILSISLMVNLEYLTLMRKGPRAWLQIRAFGRFNEEVWNKK